uniref:ubiquitinyl hydrolase 1 n=1 Tax=Tetraodon nigroviridis TaxID=99883 RepID=H3CGA5_TETNG
ARCVAFLKENRELYEAFVEGDFEEYLCKLQDPQQWVGEVEINALAIMYKRDFLIFQEPGKPAVNITDNNFKDKVQLCFMNGNHYDSVYPISRVKNAGMCQSILYELLYGRVFKMDQGLQSLCQRFPRPTDALSDDNMPFCGSSEESDLDTSEAVWVESETTTTKHSKGRGRRGPQLPERVRRSLNPTLYRNIEFDVWHKTKKAQQKMDYCIAAGMQFAAGDQCQVRLDGSGRSYSATVKEVPPDNGPVTVLIEELGRKQVPLWNLRPASDESSWRTVGGRDKKLSNGHGAEWEERGKGRGRGKHMPGSSSASQVAAGGSSGRGQKHHFGPPQSPKEEQGGGKSSSSTWLSSNALCCLIDLWNVFCRRATSSAEPAFGLTEEQRLAREEEEINVALVEIQLRDEHSFPALGSLVEKGSQAVVPGDQPLAPRSPSSVPDSRLPHRQQGPDSNPEVDAAPQIPPPVTGQAPETPTQPDVAQVQDLHSSDDDVCPPAQLHQPPHPSQVPPPSFPLPDVPDHPRNPSAHTQAEESLSPTQPQPEPPAPPALQPHPPQHPHLPSVPPHFQSIPGGVPLHQLSQIYQDPLYPGFPQNEKGGMAVTPPYSSNKSGDDMPRDINILRFFFNLGIKWFFQVI